MEKTELRKETEKGYYYYDREDKAIRFVHDDQALNEDTCMFLEDADIERLDNNDQALFDEIMEEL